MGMVRRVEKIYAGVHSDGRSGCRHLQFTDEVLDLSGETEKIGPAVARIDGLA